MSFKDIALVNSKDLTKSFFENKADDLFLEVAEGHVDVLETDMQLKAMSEVIDLTRKKIKPLLVAKIERDNTKELFGCKIALRNGTTLLDYSTDAEYEALKKSLSDRKELLDMAYDMSLKGLRAFDPISGEQIDVVGVKSHGDGAVSYTFKK